MSEAFVSHIGIAVTDLSKSIPTFELILGRKMSGITEVPDQKVRVALFGETAAGEARTTRVELIEATSIDSPIAKFLARHGEGLHHVCIWVDNLERKLAELKAAGGKLIDEKPRIGAEGEKIAFIHPSSANGVLVELHERSLADSDSGLPHFRQVPISAALRDPHEQVHNSSSSAIS